MMIAGRSEHICARSTTTDEAMTTAIDTIPLRKNSAELAVLRQQIRSAIASWAEFAEPEWDRFAGLFHLRWVQGGDHFLLPDASLDEICFVCSGLLRAYYLADDGAEANKAFITDHEFAGPLPAAVLGRPVVCGIQALEPSTLLVVQYADFAAYSMTQAVRAELASKGIRVHAVFPGAVDTDMLCGVEMPKTSPQEVAKAVLAAVHAGEEDIFPDPMSQSDLAARPQSARAYVWGNVTVNEQI